MNKIIANTLAVSCVALLSACASVQSPMAMGKPYTQDGLADAVKVPAGNKVDMQTVGVGLITYECKAKADTPGAFGWVFVGPQADLLSRGGAKLGSYFGPPATWASTDGSSITGSQLAVAPSGAGNIPLQLVKANPAKGAGAMLGVTYIQRVATQGGVAPASTCDGGKLGQKETVKYQADYIFWKAA
jgi:hypothetical protein